MSNKKHSNTKQFLIGAAIMIAVWALGVFASGIFPFVLDFVEVSDGIPTLSFLYPFLLVIYSVVFAAICKKKSKDAVFFGSYLFLAVPSVVYLLLILYTYLEFDFLDNITFLWILLSVIISPALSAADGFFGAVYEDMWPEGFTKEDMIFCAALFAAVVLPPIVYKLVKSKQPSA